MSLRFGRIFQMEKSWEELLVGDPENRPGALRAVLGFLSGVLRLVLGWIVPRLPGPRDRE